MSWSYGWHLPSSMMVPLADFVNHDSRADIQYEIFIKDKSFVGVSVDNKDEPIKSCL